MQDPPLLWQKPSFDILRNYLETLRQDLPLWNASVNQAAADDEDVAETAWQQKQAISWLSTLVGSQLGWLDDEEQREQVWSEASRRLAERCGRTAMGEITRRWPFKNPDFELVIREPPLVGDSLGLKTWGSSYLLAKMLPELGQRHFVHLLVPDRHVDVLELGSGTGLLGLAAAFTWKAHVVLTDLPEIMENLEFNATTNRQVICDSGGEIGTAVFQWGGPDETVDARFRQQHKYPIVIVADPLYDDNHPHLLAITICQQLGLDENARALIMVPERDQTTKELRDIFQAEMNNLRNPFACLVEGRLTGQDDWGSNQEDGAVECWWAVFARRTPRVPLPA